MRQLMTLLLYQKETINYSMKSHVFLTVLLGHKLSPLIALAIVFLAVRLINLYANGQFGDDQGRFLLATYDISQTKNFILIWYPVIAIFGIGGLSKFKYPVNTIAVKIIIPLLFLTWLWQDFQILQGKSLPNNELRYHWVKTAADIIVNDHTSNINVVNLISGDTLAHPLRYELAVRKKPVLSQQMYKEAENLYVITNLSALET